MPSPRARSFPQLARRAAWPGRFTVGPGLLALGVAGVPGRATRLADHTTCRRRPAFPSAQKVPCFAYARRVGSATRRREPSRRPHRRSPTAHRPDHVASSTVCIGGGAAAVADADVDAMAGGAPASARTCASVPLLSFTSGQKARARRSRGTARRRPGRRGRRLPKCRRRERPRGVRIGSFARRRGQ